MEEKYKNEVIKASKERALSADEIKILYKYKYTNEYFKKEKNEKKKLIIEAINIELARNANSCFFILGFNIIGIAEIIFRTLALNRKKKIFNGRKDVEYFFEENLRDIESDYRKKGWTVATDENGDFFERTLKMKV